MSSHHPHCHQTAPSGAHCAAAQASFDALLAGLRRSSAQQPDQRLVLLQLEQMWKIETQLVLPALDASPSRHALQEVELLRSLGVLVERCEPAERELAWTVLQGLAELHFARVDALLQAPCAAHADWPALLGEARSWLAQWEDEMRAQGDIEDEDRDPVGLPPR